MKNVVHVLLQSNSFTPSSPVQSCHRTRTIGPGSLKHPRWAPSPLWCCCSSAWGCSQTIIKSLMALWEDRHLRRSCLSISSVVWPGCTSGSWRIQPRLCERHWESTTCLWLRRHGNRWRGLAEGETRYWHFDQLFHSCSLFFQCNVMCSVMCILTAGALVGHVQVLHHDLIIADLQARAPDCSTWLWDCRGCKERRKVCRLAIYEQLMSLITSGAKCFIAII